MVLSTEYYNHKIIAKWLGDDDEGYYKLVRQMWHEQEEFILNEHDIVPWPGAFCRIWGCEHLLCAYPAPYAGATEGYGYGIGTLRFSKELLSKYPDFMDRPEANRDWKYIDGEVWSYLGHNMGVQIHYHDPPVLHLNKRRLGYEPMRLGLQSE